VSPVPAAHTTPIKHYLNGAINSFTYGNGIVHTSHQNTRQLPDLNKALGVTNDAYTYDENGSLHSIADNQRNLNSRTMGYDDLGRLTTVLAPQSWGTATYDYDGIDNLTKSTITGGGSARTLTHNFDANNRLGSILGTGEPFNAYYSYDSQGNVATRRDLGYTFDIANRMTAVNGRATYLYDGLGHRFSTVTSTTNVVQVYTQAGQLLQTGAAGTTGTRYIYLHNRVLAEVAGGTVTFNHTDALGSPVAQTSGTGALLNNTTYEPYGYVSAGTKHNIGFTGHVNDNESGLIYMQQRYYDPIAGRMLSIDPVATDANTGGSFNRYKYAENNPYRYVDPDGRFSESACADMVGNCTNYGGGGSPGPTAGVSAGAKAGAVVGAIAGGMVAGGCDFLTAGGCVLANPLLVSGGGCGWYRVGCPCGRSIGKGLGSTR
jgi:RHS repeat-associated protein